MKSRPDPVQDAAEQKRIADMKRAAREANRPPTQAEIYALSLQWGAKLKPRR